MLQLDCAMTPRCRPPSPLPPPGGGSPWLFGQNFGLSGRGSCKTRGVPASAVDVGNPALQTADNQNDCPQTFLAPLPLHPYLHRKVLSSGLEVFVLPHAHPKASLEVHLEMHAGSTGEGENERGMAHLCEHLIFMGNRKRGEVVALQGEANAFTDFHHTVYFVSWRGGGEAQSREASGQEVEDPAERAGITYKLKVALELMREVFTVPICHAH